jgi:hypothetical protein
MPGIEPDDVSDLCEKIQDLKETLLQPQAELLDAIVKAAWSIAASEESFENGFDGCFTPDEAALILAYSGGHTPQNGLIKGHASLGGLIEGATGTDSLIRGVVIKKSPE